MYSGMLKNPFPLEESALRYAGEREEYWRLLKQNQKEEEPLRKEECPPLSVVPISSEEKKEETGGVRQLLELISPEDSALFSLIVFLLCDNTENDVVLLGILLYVLLSK